jgi:predicted AlkP superfamily pyrophosphatase or phosphodiesterase
LTQEGVPGSRQQACSLPREWLELTQRGYFEPRSGQISLIPRTPAYMQQGKSGWSHSGPWPYLQDVPLVFYGPGVIDEGVQVDRPVDLADVAPTTAALLKGSLGADGTALKEVVTVDQELVTRPNLRLILTIVWDGGGWNTLRQWPDDWPNLKALMEGGVSYTAAKAGSSPSVTPAVHTTIGTGFYPATHGVTGVPVRNDQGEVVDAFLDGRSSRFMQVLALAERWDVQNDNEALVGMVGYEPWHLGMIGKGAESRGGDKDHAAWLNVETNGWKTNPDHYELPRSLSETGGLEEDLDELDAADGDRDRAWGAHKILDDPSRIEETPAFIRYHTRAMLNMMEVEGYGDDDVTDLLFTNYKQIDRVGHYFNMASEEVHESLVETDDQLGVILDRLERHVGRGRYAIVLTADHGQQADAGPIDGYPIDPNEVKADIAGRFGPIVRAVWPTEVFLLPDEMRKRGVTEEEVAEFLSGYRLRDNVRGPAALYKSAGEFEPSSRLFDLAIRSALLPEMSCRPG